MPDVNLTYTAGTVTVNPGDTVVVGVATLWDQPTNVRQWDLISIDGGPLVPIVASAIDASHISIPAWTGAAKAGVPYVIYQVSPLRFVGAQAMVDVETMLAGLNTDGWYRYVNPAFADPTAAGIVANEGQFALKFTTGQLWVMSGGVWVLTGTFKALGTPAPYDNAKTYNLNDVATINGSSYVWINPTPGAGHAPPNATFWTVLAGKGDTGALPLLPLVPWVTGVAMVAGPPASYVSQLGSSYECLISHTSGVFATDLAAGKWGLVASKGDNALTYGGSSATSLAISIASKDFTDVPLILAYQVSNYVRASSAANGANFMEGVLTAYSAGHFTINVTKIGGSGTHTDWKFSIAGAPGTGDLLSTNNLSELTNKATARTNLQVAVATAALAASQNFNSVIAAGSYYTIDNASTNAPATLAFWYLTVEVYGANPTTFVKQTATGLDNSPGLTWVRVMVSGTWQSWRSMTPDALQIVQSAPGVALNPTSTISTTPVMMGMGGTIKITPVNSTRVKITIHAHLTNTNANGQVFAQLRWGTGTAPANGVAATGTQIGANRNTLSAAANQSMPYSAGGVISGLTLGTTYWFDVALNSGNVAGSGAFLQSVDYTIEEI